jgi:hypothetical protein
MDATQFTTALRSYYLKRDAASILKLINGFKSSAAFGQLYRSLVKRKKIAPSSGKIETILQALLKEIDADILDNRRLVIDATFYDIAEHFKKKFNDQISEIFIETQIPSDFIASIRSSHETGDNSKLTENLVNNYKRELTRLEHGRKSVMEALQGASNFPLANASEICRLLDELHQQLRTDYKYLSIKPHFLAIAAVGRSIDSDVASQADDEMGSDSLLPFKHYRIFGEEPSIISQIELQIAINRLFQYLKSNQLINVDELTHYWTKIAGALNHKGDNSLSPKEWKTLADLLYQINSDIDSISRKLAATFIDEYRCAEEQMRLRHIIIQNELTYTEEYLNQVANSEQLANQADPEKIQVLMDKLLCLRETFPISERQKEAAAKKSFGDVERYALGVSTVISPNQLTDWIKIYSIIFSNVEYLTSIGKSVNFLVMRQLISNLTAFHLYDNIAQLKNIVERNLSASSEERSNQFKRFNEALKQKLLGLMGTNVDQELSLKQMIDELGFLQNKSVQFLIAETFKGFQHIVDAFNTSTTEYFVRDQDALIKESRTLYNQICNQTMRMFRNDNTKNKLLTRFSGEAKKKSWLARLFS